MSVYYSLKVSRVHSVVWKKEKNPTPSLYVEIKLGDAIQKTNTIDAVTPSWNDTLPLVCPETPKSLSIQLKRKSKLKHDIIGCAEVQLVDLRDKCKNNDETELCLFPVEAAQSSESSAVIVLLLKNSDVKTNAEIALRNLIKESIPKNETLDNADSVATEGNTVIMQNSDLVKAIVKAVPEIDQFVAIVDKITDANPYLKVAWYATSVFYKIVSAQIKVDQRLEVLAKRLVTIFGFVRDADHLRVILRSLERTIYELLDVITTCCLLLRKYIRRSFLGRIRNSVDKAQMIDLEEQLGRLKTDLNEGFTRQIVITQVHIKKQVDILQMKTRQDEDVDASDRSACLEGTRMSYRKRIEEWVVSGSSQNIFWLNGVAGSGKSTIATTIAQKFRSSFLGAYLIFKRGKSKPGSIFRTLAYRLAKSNSTLAYHISEACSNTDFDSQTMEEDFKILFKDVLLSASDVEGPVLIILDGLDECGTSMERSMLVESLKNDFSELPPKFRFLITSRPEDDIVQHLSSKSHVHEVRLDHTTDTSRRDVQAYLDREMRRVVTGKAPDDWDWEHVLKVLGDAANGLFIWASTAVKFISGQTYKYARLEELVSNPKSHTPEGLYSTVFSDSINWNEKMSSGISMASHFSMIFTLVLFGKEQFSTMDVDRILGLNSYEGSDTILSKLQSVIAYEDRKRIRLQHTSFSDYLTSPDCRGNPWFIDGGSQKQMIAGRCFKVMADLLRFNICKLETSFVRNDAVTDLVKRIDKNIPAHLKYVCRFWAQHLRDAPFSDDLLGLLTTFAYNGLLHWFEVLSLTNNFYHLAGQALTDAINWIGTRDPELTEFLMDAIKLASIFAVPISESTPHIYVSMLPLTKLDSKVSAHYASKAASLVTVDRKGTKSGTSLLKLLEGHTSDVTSVGFSPDGKRIVSGSEDNTVRVWDVDSGKVDVGPFEGHTDVVTSVGFSHDGKRIVSASRDKTVRVWDVDSRKVVAGPFEGHTDEVTSVGFSPDGKRVVSGSYDRTVRVWDVDSGKIVAGPFEGHTKVVTSVGFLPDGKRVVSGSDDKTVQVWDVDSGKVVVGLFEGHTDGITSVGFSPDGKRVVSGSWDNTVRVWDADSGKVVAGPFEGHTGGVSSVGLSPDGTRVVSGSHDKTVRVWDVDSRKVVAGPFEGHTWWVSSVGFSPDGKRVVSGSDDKTVRVWDVDSGKVVVGLYEGHTGGVTSVGLSPDGKRVVSGSWDKKVLVWDVDSGKVVAGPFEGHTDMVTSVGFSPDGKRVISGSEDNTVRVWDVDSGKVIAGPFEGHTDRVASVGFSPDGKRVVSGSYDRTVRVWDVDSGKVVAGPFEGHTDMVTSVGFSLDGKRVISASWDNSVRVWDVDSGKVVHGPVVKADPSTRTISQDGMRVVDISLNLNHIRVSSVDDGEDLSNSPATAFGWVICEDAWIRRGDDLLLWIPPDIRPTLCEPRTIILLNCEFSTRLDFSSCALGGDWETCFRSESST